MSGRPRKISMSDQSMSDEKVSVLVRLNPKVWMQIKLMAVKEECTIGDLASEAVATWFKWMAKADYEEAEESMKEVTEAQMKKAAELWKVVLANSQKHKLETRLQKALRSRRFWYMCFPGKAWPGRMKKK